MDIVISMDEYNFVMSSTLLNLEDKTIFELAYNGLNNCQIANKLSCSEGKVRYRRKRIISQITTYLNTDYKNTYTIYKHTFPNGKVYIGVTKLSPNVRWNNGLGYRHNTEMFNDIVLFGWNNITHEIIGQYNITAAEATAKEKELIIRHKSNDVEHGYNRQ